MDAFDTELTKNQIEMKKDQITELQKRKDELPGTAKEHMSQWSALHSEQEKLRKQVEELEVQLKSNGKALTPNRVAQLLKKAGYETRETYTTAVRGWHEHGGDFSVVVDPPNREELRVDIVIPRMSTTTSKAKKIAQTLKESGMAVKEVMANTIKIDRLQRERTQNDNNKEHP